MSKFRGKNIAYQPEGSAETGFNRIVNEHVEERRKLLKEINTWRILFSISWVFVLFSLIGWYQTKNLPKTTPLIIEVQADGRAKYLGKVDHIRYETIQPKEYMIKAHLKDFITYTREIILDSDVMYDNILRAFGWVSVEIKQRLNNEIQTEDPFSKVGYEKRLVEVETIIQTTGATWQVDWYEVATTISGIETKRIKYRGLFTLQQQEPGNEKERERNPLGIYITDYNIAEVKQQY